MSFSINSSIKMVFLLKKTIFVTEERVPIDICTFSALNKFNRHLVWQLLYLRIFVWCTEQLRFIIKNLKKTIAVQYQYTRMYRIERAKREKRNSLFDCAARL